MKRFAILMCVMLVAVPVCAGQMDELIGCNRVAQLTRMMVAARNRGVDFDRQQELTNRYFHGDTQQVVSALLTQVYGRDMENMTENEAAAYMLNQCLEGVR